MAQQLLTLTGDGRLIMNGNGIDKDSKMKTIILKILKSRRVIKFLLHKLNILSTKSVS